MTDAREIFVCGGFLLKKVDRLIVKGFYRCKKCDQPIALRLIEVDRNSKSAINLNGLIGACDQPMALRLIAILQVVESLYDQPNQPFWHFPISRKFERDVERHDRP